MLLTVLSKKKKMNIMLTSNNNDNNKEIVYIYKYIQSIKRQLSINQLFLQ